MSLAEIQPTLFDTSQLEPSLAHALRVIAGDIKSLDGSAAIAMIVKGKRLLQARDELLKASHPLLSKPDGFYLWAQSELGYSKRTVQDWIRCAEALGDVDDAVIAQFDVVALRRIVAGSTPDAARQAALEAAKNGDRISSDRAEEIVAAYRLAKKRKDAPLQIGQTVTAVDGRRLQIIGQAGAIIEAKDESGGTVLVLWSDIRRSSLGADQKAGKPNAHPIDSNHSIQLLRSECSLLSLRLQQCEALLRAAAEAMSTATAKNCTQLRKSILELLGD